MNDIMKFLNIDSPSLLIQALIILGVSILLVAAAFFSFSLILFDVPSTKTKKAQSSLLKNVSSAPNSFDILSEKVGLWLSKTEAFKAVLNPLKQQRMQTQFEILDIKKTPAEHVANCITKGFFIVLLSPFGLLASLLMGKSSYGIGLMVLIMITGIALGFLEYNSIDRLIDARKEAIESSLPRFIPVVTQTLKNERDVIKMLTNFVDNDDSALSKELRITLADMKTGNYENALNNFAKRNNSVLVSDMARGLVAAMRGDDTTSYFELLTIKIQEMQDLQIEKAALKLPKKSEMLIKVLLVTMLLVYIVIFATVFKESFATLAIK